MGRPLAGGLQRRDDAHPRAALGDVGRARRVLGAAHRHADRRDAGGRQLRLVPRAPLLHRLHARGRQPAAVLRLSLHVHVRHAGAGDERQLPAAVLRLGRRGARLLPADRLLVPEARGQCGGHQGVRGQPRRRLRLRARHLRHLRRVRHHRLRRRVPRRARRGRQADGVPGPPVGYADRAVPAAVHGRHGQVGAVPAAHLAAGRHGRPDARLGADPRRHHGDGRRVHGGAALAAVRAGAGRAAGGDAGGGRDRVLRRHGRPGAERHQARGGLFDLLAARLHVRRLRRRRLLGRHLPSLHARLLQGAAVPRRRLGDPRHASRAGHAQDGRPRPQDAHHLDRDADRHAVADGRRHPASDRLCRLPLQGCHHRGGLRRAHAGQLRVLAAGRRRLHDRVLLVAADLHDLPRQDARRSRDLRARAREPVGDAGAAAAAGAGRRGRRLRLPEVLHRRRLRRILARLAGRGTEQPHPPRHARDPGLGRLGAVRGDGGRASRSPTSTTSLAPCAAAPDGAHVRAGVPVPAQQVVLRRALRLAVRAPGVLDRAAVLEEGRRRHHRRARRRQPGRARALDHGPRRQAADRLRLSLRLRHADRRGADRHGLHVQRHPRAAQRGDAR